MSEDKEKQILRHEIFTCFKANEVPITGKLWLGVVFLSLSGLKSLCGDLSINIQPITEK
jgi:hypothetical protein